MADTTARQVTVLVTNDDGIDSPGLWSLAVAIRATGADVLVAAPATNMSGASAAMGPVEPTVRIERRQLDGLDVPCYAVHAPPAMIVIAAANGGFGVAPTAVLSGVNDGVNLGRAILHSGTVGAALTGQNLGLPSVAVSLHGAVGWDVAAHAGVRALDELLAADHPMVANVNVPAGADASTPVERTRLARFGSVVSAIDGDRMQFQLTIDPHAPADEPANATSGPAPEREAWAATGTDVAAVRDGRISMTILGGIAGYAATASEVSLQMRTLA